MNARTAKKLRRYAREAYSVSFEEFMLRIHCMPRRQRFKMALQLVLARQAKAVDVAAAEARLTALQTSSEKRDRKRERVALAGA